MAGLTQTLADRAGLSVDDYMKENAEDLSSALRMIVQYPKNSWMNSPLMTTLNVAAFPARFNIKVAVVAAKALSRTSGVTQMLVINGALRAHNWLNSDEGVTWQTQNADGLNVLKYFSPLYHLDYVAKVLTGDIHGFGDLGELGGLPFGFVSNILNDEGILHDQAPYVSQKTGQELPSYVPKTGKAFAATALNDFLASLFTYPGADVGFTSKSSMVGEFTKNIDNAAHSDTSQFQAVTPPLTTPEQQQAGEIQKAAGTAPPPTPQATFVNPMQVYMIPPPDLTGHFLTQPRAAKTSSAKPKPVPAEAQLGEGSPNIPDGSATSTASTSTAPAVPKPAVFNQQLLGSSVPKS
jgi:hypothetical protein